MELDYDFLKTFRRVEVNIPLLDAIKQIPKYAKFLKDLCTHKSKDGHKCFCTYIGQNCFCHSPSTLPQKCKDPGIFSVPCTIGDCTFTDAMLDLGALFNVMPTSVYKSLHLGDLKPTNVI